MAAATIRVISGGNEYEVISYPRICGLVFGNFQNPFYIVHFPMARVRRWCGSSGLQRGGCDEL